jgi:hypothetical protein
VRRRLNGSAACLCIGLVKAELRIFSRWLSPGKTAASNLEVGCDALNIAWAPSWTPQFVVWNCPGPPGAARRP